MFWTFYKVLKTRLRKRKSIKVNPPGWQFHISDKGFQSSKLRFGLWNDLLVYSMIFLKRLTKENCCVSSNKVKLPFFDRFLDSFHVFVANIFGFNVPQSNVLLLVTIKSGEPYFVAWLRWLRWCWAAGFFPWVAVNQCDRYVRCIAPLVTFIKAVDVF